MWLRAEHDTTGNLEMMSRLKAQGYKFDIDSYGYQVWYKDEHLHGAGSNRKPKHWRHHRADAKMHLFNAVCLAYDHQQKGGD